MISDLTLSGFVRFLIVLFYSWADSCVCSLLKRGFLEQLIILFYQAVQYEVPLLFPIWEWTERRLLLLGGDRLLFWFGCRRREDWWPSGCVSGAACSCSNTLSLWVDCGFCFKTLPHLKKKKKKENPMANCIYYFFFKTVVWEAAVIRP